MNFVIITVWHLALALLLLAGCVSVNVGGSTTSENPRFEYVAPTGDWLRLEGRKGADTFRSPSSGAVLGVSTACDNNVDATYDDLIAVITSTLDDSNTIEPTAAIEGTHLPARGTRIQGTLDDQHLEIVAIVLKSKACVYDVTLTGKSISAADHESALNTARTLKERT